MRSQLRSRRTFLTARCQWPRSTFTPSEKVDSWPVKLATPAAARRSRGARWRRKTLALLAMCLGVLVAQIDTSVVNLATHAIGEAFRAGVAPLQWVLDAYNLVYATLLLGAGLVADMYGRRLAFAIGSIVMAAGSLACAFAPDIGVLIAAHALTGIGAALLLPSSLAIIRVAWPDEAARGRVLGIWASCNGLAFAIGPTLGGLLIEGFGWRSVFLVVVPLATAAFVLACTAVPESADPQERHLDLPGQALGMLALGGLGLAMSCRPRMVRRSRATVRNEERPCDSTNSRAPSIVSSQPRRGVPCSL